MASQDTADGSRAIVVGGYGHVGRRLAAVLKETRTVVVAGRRPDAAARTAAELDVLSAPAPVDAATGQGLDQVVQPGDLVVNSSGDHREARLFCRSIALGCHYTDLTADPATIAAMLDLDGAARTSGTSAVIGIGLAPGATNLLACAAIDVLPEADHVDIGLLLSLTDGFGSAAVEWTLAAIDSPLSVEYGGQTADVVAFRRRTRLRFGAAGTYPVYEFGFPEQVFLPATLPVPLVRGWFTLRPALAARGFARLSGHRWLRSTLARPRVRRALARLAGCMPEPRRGPRWLPRRSHGMNSRRPA